MPDQGDPDRDRPGRQGGDPGDSAEHPRQPGPRADGKKSAWDWRYLSSLLIPILIGTIGWGLWQTHLQNQSNQQLAREQHQSDVTLSTDQQRATILQTYIDNMQSLLLNPNPAKSIPADEVRQPATVQTITTLRSLDAGRNAIVLQFLQGASLIGVPDAVINLSNADLSNDNLSGADLSGVALGSANLTGADLSDANLSNASLFDAHLNGANLSGANLSGATLTSATLNGAKINNATLAETRLNGAILAGAQLNGADLSDADLISADLTETSFRDADLSDADLTGSYITQAQLDAVNSCTYAILSIGLTCHHNATIDLTYWYTESPAERPVIVKLINQFEQQNPKIHINGVAMNYYQTETDFEDAAAEGQAPDILRSDVGWVAQFASQGYLLNIDSLISQSDPSDYLPVALADDYYHGHYYGMPQVTDFLALLYNKAELAAAGITSAPATMTDFEADAVKVHQSNPKIYGFETDGTSYNALPFIYTFGGGMLDQNNNILVNNNGSVNGLTFLLKLQNVDKVMPANINYSNGPVTSPVTDFTNGKTAMIFGGPYDVPGILTGPSFKSDPGNLGIASIPTCPTTIVSTCQAGHTGSPSGGQSYVISADTKHPLEAEEFIQFMSSTRRQVAIAMANHTLPTRISAQNAVRGEGFISEFLSLKYTVVPEPAIPQAGDLYDAFDPNIAAALDGVESPVAALNAVAEAWKQLLASS